MHRCRAVKVWAILALSGGLSLCFGAAYAQMIETQVVPGSVPAAIGKFHLQPKYDLPFTNRLRLAISLPLRNRKGLNQLLQQINNPASTNYHRYLTPQEFTDRFGPTPQDYAAVVNFAKSNGLTVTATYPNRTLVDVSSSVATVEKVFHVKLHVYKHPTGYRDFFAPDSEASVDLNVPILHIDGLNNFALPRPAGLKRKSFSGFSPASGSGPNGLLMGSDFRNAYTPGVALNGAGQIVALFELDGYYTNDIATYESDADLPATLVTNVLVDGYSGAAEQPDDAEVALDIEMVISMATNLAEVVVYEADNNGDTGEIADLLNRIASDDIANQISSSWLIGDDPSFDTAYQQMAAQGQSFFQASGDDGAYYTGDLDEEEWADDTNITIVGGTTLTMNGSGDSYSSETVWNWFSTGTGTAASGGGTNYNSIPIPAWQSGINMQTNGGSTSLRNIPDVAMNADNIFVVADNGQSEWLGGTSAASPLWAAFTALANQRAAIFGASPMGFLNPVIYAIGASPGYSANFYDITTGNNTNDVVGNEYFAVPGYDLCTGWGSPNGTNLLYTLVPADTLTVAPLFGVKSRGPCSGPFSPSTQTFYLTNSSAAPLAWALVNTSCWLNVSVVGGTLYPGDSTNEVVSINAAADNLTVGTYGTSLQFSNGTSQVVQTLPFTLQVSEPLVITPPGNLSAFGPPGGPFSLSSQEFTLSNYGDTPLNWQLSETSAWFDVSATCGTLAGGAETNVIVTLNNDANNVGAGIYAATVTFTNQGIGTVQSRQFLLLIGQSLVQNGDFETGNFADWTLDGDAGSYDFVDNGENVTLIAPYSGNFFAAFGEVGSLAYLSQTLPTVSGQPYLLSLWLNSPDADECYPNEFSVTWNGDTMFDQVNIPPIYDDGGWTNLQFIVTATNDASLLQIGGRDDNYYLGLDDVNLAPIPAATMQSLSVPATRTGGMTFSWNAMTGLSYQVQMTTNLLQLNWVTLQTITATNSPITFTDTNPIAGAPQEFYRLLLAP